MATSTSLRAQADELEAELSGIACQHKGFPITWCPQCAATQIEQALAAQRSAQIEELAARMNDGDPSDTMTREDVRNWLLFQVPR